MKTLLMAPLALLCLNAFASPTFPQRDIIPGKYLITLKDDQVPAVLAQMYGLNPTHVYKKAINGFAASIPEEMIDSIRQDSRVLRVEEDKIVHAIDMEEEFAVTWGLDRIDQRDLPLNGAYNYSANGSNVTAYIIDTGIKISHNEFGNPSRASFGYDAYGGSADDCHGHGTHVAGTVGGLTYGVAKNVRFKAVKVLDCNGSGSLAGVVAGVDWVTANRVLPAVANMSLGLNGVSDTVDAAVRNMINSGVATAIAAGNSNADACGYSPARVAEAMTIGASTISDIRASFSNFGNCVDWFAPGQDIESAWIPGPSNTNTISGTSMATPHVVGVAALYLQNHASASPAQVRDALYNQSTKNKIASANSANNHLVYSIESVTPPTDGIKPNVSLASPSNGSRWFRWTIVPLQANASDNVRVVSVKMYVNNSLICTDTTAPYSCPWRMPLFGSGPYNVQAKAYDAAGNEGVSAISVIRPR